MANIVFEELGFPIVLVDPPTREVRGQAVLDLNMRTLQAEVFRHLIAKRSRLTGAELRFVRKHLRMRQADFARVLNMANHSVVSQWEGREDEALAEVAELDDAYDILSRDVLVVDLRLPDRLVVKLTPEAATHRASMIEDRLDSKRKAGRRI